jgi:hypothetical protein
MVEINKRKSSKAIEMETIIKRKRKRNKQKITLYLMIMTFLLLNDKKAVFND